MSASIPPTLKRRDFLASASTALGLMAFGLPFPLSACAGTGRLAAPGAKIASLGIYPPISICRVGSSPASNGFYAPEVPGSGSQPARWI